MRYAMAKSLMMAWVLVAAAAMCGAAWWFASGTARAEESTVAEQRAQEMRHAQARQAAGQPAQNPRRETVPHAPDEAAPQGQVAPRMHHQESVQDADVRQKRAAELKHAEARHAAGESVHSPQKEVITKARRHGGT